MSRSIFFIIVGFWRPCKFLGIRRIAYEFYCPYSGSSVNRVPMHSPALPDRRAIKRFASLKLTPREAEVLFWILGAKTGTICKHVEHIFGKLNVENRTAAAVVALETSRSGAPASEGDPGQPWTAVAGFVTTQLCAFCSDSPELYGQIARLVA